MADCSNSIENKLQKLLNEQRKTGQFCDVLIKLSDNIQQWAAHFCVIAPQSEFIGNKYFQQEDMQFSIHNPLEIEICNFTCSDCLNDVIDFMYSNDVTIFDDHSEHFVNICKILGITDLLKCIIKDTLTAEGEVVVNIPEVELSKENDNVIFKVETKNNACQQRRLRNTGGIEYKNRKEPSQSKMHNCPGCAFKCYRPAEMFLHLTLCPTTNTNCPMCDIYFETLTEFKGHLTRHDNIKAFYCNDCSLRFTTKTALYLHTPKHSKETPHICPHCNRGFKWKHSLNSHLIVHSNEKKLLCDECGYSTSHLKTLRTHQLGHTGFMYRCTMTGCLYTSRRKENLKTHIMTHRKETPFVCEVCGYRFSQAKNLKRHALLHVSKDKHKCPNCPFSSYRTDKLKEHISRTHPEKSMSSLLQLTTTTMDAYELPNDIIEDHIDFGGGGSGGSGGSGDAGNDDHHDEDDAVRAVQLKFNPKSSSTEEQLIEGQHTDDDKVITNINTNIKSIKKRKYIKRKLIKSKMKIKKTPIPILPKLSSQIATTTTTSIT